MDLILNHISPIRSTEVPVYLFYTVLILSHKFPKSLPHYTRLFSRNLCYVTIWSQMVGHFMGYLGVGREYFQLVW